MSSSKRLKRKLEDMGVDLSGGKANENFCLIGTPLPPLEKSKKDAGEFVPLWKQEVRDEKGRRRLHGAFTGGFSAGYFNTVGSKEGWTPSTFVSSRSDRAKQKAARPEDFMDEEDLQDIKDSRTIVDTADEMDLTGGGQASVEENETASLAATLEASMLPSPNDSAGARILKKMGWRLGQGIGPRMSYKQRKAQDFELGIPGSEKDEEDPEAQKHTYPRRDTKVMLFDRKDNAWGLGYSPGMGLNESVGLGVSGKKSVSKGPSISSGFGLGALNDADEDDVDVYDPITGHTSHRRREAYDVAHDDDDNSAFGIRKGGRDAIPAPAANPLAPQFFRDGQPVLKGFTLSNKPVMEDRWFPLPEVPKGWTPNPKRVWEQKTGLAPSGNKENIPQTGQGAKASWDAKMSADERGQLLGETPLPAAPRSIFEFMSKKDRERLENIKANLTAGQPKAPPTALADEESSPFPDPLPWSMPRTEPHVAQAALRGFKPFAADPAKQARYEIYLESQLGSVEGGSKPELKPSANQNTDEFRKEVEDYAKAALLFKPMSGAMAGRFQSAGVVEMSKPQEGLWHGSAEEGKDSSEPNKKAPASAVEKEDPKVHAAKMGMYGHLTRETKVWIPARLLCKRFGVKDPDVSAADDADAGGPSSSTSSWQKGQTEFDGGFGTSEGANSGTSHTNPASGDLSEAKRGGPKDLANVGLGEDEDQGRDTLTYERPSMDVFKAIFASDDEDEDEDNEEEKEDAKEPTPTAPVTEPIAEPSTATPPLPLQNEVVDLATFKPTFIPRVGKEKEKDHEKVAKKEKKKKEKTKGVLSFEMDEDGGGLELKPERPKKKKRKDKDKPKNAKAGDEDDDMWVEKPVADAVKELPPVAARGTNDADMEVEPEIPASGPRGRKRAIDFL